MYRVHGRSFSEALSVQHAKGILPDGEILREIDSRPLRGRVWRSFDDIPTSRAVELWHWLIVESISSGLWPVVGIHRFDSHNFGGILPTWEAPLNDLAVVERLNSIPSRNNVDNTGVFATRLALPDGVDRPLPSMIPGELNLNGRFGLVFAPGSASMSSEVRHYGIDGMVLGSWLERFNGVVFHASYYVLILVMRRRPKDVEDAEILACEAKLAEVRITDARERDFGVNDFFNEAVWFVWWNG